MTQPSTWPVTAVTLGMHPVTLVREHVRVTTNGVEQSLVNVSCVQLFQTHLMDKCLSTLALLAVLHTTLVMMVTLSLEQKQECVYKCE